MHDKQTYLTVHMSKRLHNEPAAPLDGFESQKKKKEKHEECEEKDSYSRGKERQHSFSVGPNLDLFHKRSFDLKLL